MGIEGRKCAFQLGIAAAVLLSEQMPLPQKLAFGRGEKERAERGTRQLQIGSEIHGRSDCECNARRSTAAVLGSYEQGFGDVMGVR